MRMLVLLGTARLVQWLVLLLDKRHIFVPVNVSQALSVVVSSRPAARGSCDSHRGIVFQDRLLTVCAVSLAICEVVLQWLVAIQLLSCHY